MRNLISIRKKHEDGYFVVATAGWSGSAATPPTALVVLKTIEGGFRPPQYTLNVYTKFNGQWSCEEEVESSDDQSQILQNFVTRTIPLMPR